MKKNTKMDKNVNEMTIEEWFYYINDIETKVKPVKKTKVKTSKKQK